MKQNEFEAWLIHKKKIGENRSQLMLFTEEQGLIDSFSHSTKTQIFTPLWVCFDIRQERYYTRKIENSAATLNLKGKALYSAFYLNELIYYLLAPLVAAKELFQAYVLCLTQLVEARTQECIEILLRRFEWRLLCTCGYAFSLSKEGSGLAIDAQAYYGFVAGEGLIRQEKGILGEHILALAVDDLSPAYLPSAKILMRQALGSVLGSREIKARSMFAM
jgi:DNA repair protein RecO (recombination protein O)